MWTPGAVDFFRILNEQVAVVAEVESGEMLLRVGQVGAAAAGTPSALLSVRSCQGLCRAQALHVWGLLQSLPGLGGVTLLVSSTQLSVRDNMHRPAPAPI
jgi:hypothetical protein